MFNDAGPLGVEFGCHGTAPESQIFMGFL